MAKRKAPTKKDLEAKIAELEAKLASISSQAGETAKKAPPPPPKPAEGKKAEAPKPAEEKATPPATISQALENAWRSYPESSTHDYKKKTTGFSPSPNRYYGRLHAPVGTVQTSDWNLQKAKVTGYTQPSNQYFATRQRLAYHPADKNFTGYGLVVEGAAAESQQAPPPPPQPEPQAEQAQQTTASSGGGSKKSDLESYEAEYLARLKQNEKEHEELMRAAEELAAKRRAESGGSSEQAGSSKGTLPKGF